MAAESLSRRAFPEASAAVAHVVARRRRRRARCWAAPSAATCSCPLELALIAAFYYATNRWLGWWQPSESLTDPNILGTAVPALAPIALSLQAGFMEECVFRAMPLALAALIGAHFGHRRARDRASRSSLQAVIFGGAHANYPGFPAYSRLVELLVPSVLWALDLPALRAAADDHPARDCSTSCCSRFRCSWSTRRAAGCSARWSSARGCVPLAIVVARRLRAGAWSELADAWRNGGWQPPARATHVDAPAAAGDPAAAGGAVAAFQRALPWLGVAGFASVAAGHAVPGRRPAAGAGSRARPRRRPTPR